MTCGRDDVRIQETVTGIQDLAEVGMQEVDVMMRGGSGRGGR